MNDQNNVLKADQKLLKKKLFKNIRKQSRKAYNNHKIRKSYKGSNKRLFQDFLGIDSVFPIEERRLYNLEGEIGSKEAHFVKVRT